MDSFSRRAVGVFVHVTGASESAAQRVLQAHNGDLEAAINSFFNDREELAHHAPTEELDASGWMEEDKPGPLEVHESYPFWGRTIAASCEDEKNVVKLNEDTNDGVQGEVSCSELKSSAGPPEKLEKVSGNPFVHETDACVMKMPSSPVRGEMQNAGGQRSIGPVSLGSLFEPRGGHIMARKGGHVGDLVVGETMGEDGQDIEEEMLRAVIEVSRMDDGSDSWKTTHAEQGPPNTEATQSGMIAILGSEDDDLARAVSLSLKTAEEEKVMREQTSVSHSFQLETMEADGISSGSNSTKVVSTERLTLLFGSSNEENDEVQEQPLVRRRMYRQGNRGTGRSAAVQLWEDAPVHLEPEDSSFALRSGTGTSVEQIAADQISQELFQAEEWGGISFEEHDEAVMLEAAYGLGAVPYQSTSSGSNEVGSLPLDVSERHTWQPFQQVPSPSVAAHRRLREQQDDEYHASLAADREKEIRALQDAQSRQQKEEEAASAAKAEERMQQEQEVQQLQAAKELEIHLSAKKKSLPPEPGAEEASVVTILVRMPDGRRQGRRFQTFDTLQSLFDFVDVYGGIKPGSYRLVRQYPRQTFGDGEQACSLHEAGLNGKQEALYLEMI
eukprot:TRINITY_DN13813_c0_g2_i5.p1 TRINITY_DN13813_c0_g2~~TRINITY_DN13813_c0_g2_i5.p1  ORF type:complete len:614 (+),score=153.67 TRINITY_DN13813_c0_g2_i5:131-1972(+)